MYLLTNDALLATFKAVVVSRKHNVVKFSESWGVLFWKWMTNMFTILSQYSCILQETLMNITINMVNSFVVIFILKLFSTLYINIAYSTLLTCFPLSRQGFGRHHSSQQKQSQKYSSSHLVDKFTTWEKLTRFIRFS